MATTTAKAIRDTMITAVRAITPAIRADQKFLLYREDGGPFIDWADAQPAAAFRRFSIRDLGGSQPALVSSCDVEQVERTFQCVVSYPRELQPGDTDHPAQLGLDDLIESDETQVIKAIGTPGYSTLTSAVGSGSACVTHEASSVDEGGACRFLVIPLRVLYYRSMT